MKFYLIVAMLAVISLTIAFSYLRGPVVKVVTLQTGQDWHRATFSNATVQSASVVIASTSLIGYWKFDGNGADETSYGNHMVAHGDPEWTEGRFGQAVQFDGEDDLLEVPYDPTLNIPDQLTIELWIYPEQLPESGPAPVVNRHVGPPEGRSSLPKVPFVIER